MQHFKKTILILIHVTYHIKYTWPVVIEAQGSCFQGGDEAEKTMWQENKSLLTSPD